MNINKSIVVITILISCVFFGCQKPTIDKMEPAAMFMMDSLHSGHYEGSSIRTIPQLHWKIQTNGEVISSPVVYDNVVFVGSTDKRFYAIEIHDGSVKWTFNTEGEIRSTATVVDGRVYFLSYDGYLYSLDAETGGLHWKFKTNGESRHHVKDYYTGVLKPDFWDFYLSSPIVKNEIVYFGSSDHHVYALDIEKGTLVWKFKTEDRIHSSPAVQNDVLVIGSWDSNVYCLNNHNGKLKWKFETGKDTAQYVWLGIQGSPTIDKNRVFIGSRDAKMYALDLETGESIWAKDEFDRSWMPSSIAQDDQFIYTGSSDSFSFFSLNKETGDIQYKTKTNAYTFSSPAIDREMAYIGAANGRLFGIELSSGKIQWEYKTQGQKTDTLKIFDAQGQLNIPRLQELTKGITEMPLLSAIFQQGFIGSGAILSSPVRSKDLIVFGASDGIIYALKKSEQN